MSSTPLGSLLLPTRVINSSCPWSSSLDQLRELYASPFTGAVVTRTATMEGFEQDERVHGHAFLQGSLSSFNTYGYSPHPLQYYLDAVRTILGENPESTKPIIISITSSSGSELARMGQMILDLRREIGDLDGEKGSSRVGIEINTSCPNIPSHPPPSYTPLQSFPALLAPLLATLSSPPPNSPTSTTSAIFPTPTTLGLKLPPYTHIGQFNDLVAYLGTIPQGGVSYLACCNTLGGVIGFGGDLCLSEDADAGNEQGDAGLEVGRFAGMAGEAIHPLALGNINRFSLLLSSNPATSHIALVGIGGANDAASVRRFLKCGATAVACATGLGIKGVGVFEGMTKGGEEP